MSQGKTARTPIDPCRRPLTRPSPARVEGCAVAITVTADIEHRTNLRPAGPVQSQTRQSANGVVSRHVYGQSNIITDKVMIVSRSNVWLDSVRVDGPRTGLVTEGCFLLITNHSSPSQMRISKKKHPIPLMGKAKSNGYFRNMYTHYFNFTILTVLSINSLFFPRYRTTTNDIWLASLSWENMKELYM